MIPPTLAQCMARRVPGADAAQCALAASFVMSNVEMMMPCTYIGSVAEQWAKHFAQLAKCILLRPASDGYRKRHARMLRIARERLARPLDWHRWRALSLLEARCCFAYMTILDYAHELQFGSTIVKGES